MTFSASDRPKIRAALQSGPFDVLIVGGGINGAGLARDLSLRGARVALVEKNDFAFGTSSRSSRLIHGGLRYLEEASKLLPFHPFDAARQIDLVFESVTERWRMSRLARHLVRPLAFVVPGIEGSRARLPVIRVGVGIYDALALFRNYQNAKSLTRDQVLEMLPAFARNGLTGGVHYFDYRTNDARMTLENVLGAAELGAAILSRARAVAPILTHERGRTRLSGATIRDEETGETFPVRAGIVVSATGPWTDEALKALGVESKNAHPRVKPTKGIHIVVPRTKLPLNSAAALAHPRDGRVLFALPYEERSVLGTTDTFFDGPADGVRVDVSDVDYLLEVAASLFPSSKLTREDVISSWAGLRPLMNAEALGASSVPREHHILDTREGLIAIYGGKLTTYRRMCEELADHVARALEARGHVSLPRSQTATVPLPGAWGLADDEDLSRVAEALTQQGGFDRAVATHLAESYGARAARVAERVARDTTGRLGRRVDPELPFLWAEIAWAAEQEMAMTLEDAFIRRTGLFYRSLDQGLAAAATAADVMGDSLGWNSARRADEVARYTRAVESGRAWRDPPAIEGVRAAS